MADWIDLLKQRKHDQATHELQQQQEKQRTDAIIKAQLPGFLDHTAGQIQYDVGRLRQEFPEDLNYVLHFMRAGFGFSLRGAKQTSLAVGIEVDATGTQAKLTVASRSGGLHDRSTVEPVDLRVALDDNDVLSINFHGKTYGDPRDFGSALVQYVVSRVNT